MVDLTRKIAAEKENVEKALDNLKDAMGRKERSTVELAAIATLPLLTFEEGVMKLVDMEPYLDGEIF